MSKPFTPRPYQELIRDHILDTPRCAVWAGMGMGKTSSTLVSIDALQLSQDGPTLVLAPLRVARDTWPSEVSKWDQTAGLRVSAIVGSESERIAAINRKADVYTTNYDNLVWLCERMSKQWPYTTIVADESTKLKSFRLRQGGKRAQALGRVAHQSQRFIELTGTPSPNGLLDLWGQAWFMDKGQRLGRTFDAFKQRWFRPAHNGFGVEALPHAQREIQAALSDLVITVDPKDWFDLRELRTNNIYVDLPIKARKTYQEMESAMFTTLASGHEVEAFGAAAKTIKCLQLANGAVLVDEGASWRGIHDVKLEALDELIEEQAGAPVLCAYHFKSDRERILRAFPDAIDVATKEGFAQALKGKGRLWIGHPASMGHGVDGLQEHCHTACFFGHWWNLEERLQFIERIGPVRQIQAGKDRVVTVHNIVARDTVDEDVLDRHATKREVQSILMDAMKKRTK